MKKIIIILLLFTTTLIIGCSSNEEINGCWETHTQESNVQITFSNDNTYEIIGKANETTQRFENGTYTYKGKTIILEKDYSIVNRLEEKQKMNLEKKENSIIFGENNIKDLTKSTYLEGVEYVRCK